MSDFQYPEISIYDIKDEDKDGIDIIPLKDIAFKNYCINCNKFLPKIIRCSKCKLSFCNKTCQKEHHIRNNLDKCK